LQVSESVLAMVQTEQWKLEARELPMPEVADDGAILRMEVVGVCGSDVGQLSRTPPSPRIPGHENIGRIAAIGTSARHLWGLDEGDLVALEEYLVCHHCEWCHRGEYRHCWRTDIHNNPDPLRYGSTSLDRAPGLWGGYSQFLYMPAEAVWHKVPAGVSPIEASLHIALANGVQWSVIEGGLHAGQSIFIQGPGQMGAACVVAAKSVGAGPIIVSGLASDADRLVTCTALGADFVIDASSTDVREAVLTLTNGRGVDLVVDATARAGSEPTLVAIDVLRTRGGTMIVQGEANFPDFPMTRISDKYITIKPARGHSYAAVERGLALIAAGTADLDLIHTHNFPLADALGAVRATEGTPVDGVRALHCAILPWE
jgi:threonine dehydrogenase-like Zn-dependent dehydrogenase